MIPPLAPPFSRGEGGDRLKPFAYKRSQPALAFGGRGLPAESKIQNPLPSGERVRVRGTSLEGEAPAEPKKTKPSPPLGERVRVRGLVREGGLCLSGNDFSRMVFNNVGATRRVAPTNLGCAGGIWMSGSSQGRHTGRPLHVGWFLYPSPPVGERVRVRGLL
jgi:hypothetical protein